MNNNGMNQGITTLTIDGKECGARSDQTVLEVARENGIKMPTLCHLDGLVEIGCCRLCLVEIKGSNKLQAACVARVQEGMEVTTNSDRLKRYRKMIVELLFSERNHICSICQVNGHCELQAMAQELGITHITVPYFRNRFPVDASHHRFIADHNRCILCTRCIRVCQYVEGAHTWDLTGRGENTRIITDLDGAWEDSETCTGCGKCIQVCPTGALVGKRGSAGNRFEKRKILPYLEMMREGQR